MFFEKTNVYHTSSRRCLFAARKKPVNRQRNFRFKIKLFIRIDSIKTAKMYIQIYQRRRILGILVPKHTPLDTRTPCSV